MKKFLNEIEKIMDKNIVKLYNMTLRYINVYIIGAKS